MITKHSPFSLHSVECLLHMHSANSLLFSVGIQPDPPIKALPSNPSKHLEKHVIASSKNEVYVILMITARMKFDLAMFILNIYGSSDKSRDCLIYHSNYIYNLQGPKLIFQLNSEINVSINLSLKLHSIIDIFPWITFRIVLQMYCQRNSNIRE